MISHEIRTPLTAIIGVAQLLEMTDLGLQHEIDAAGFNEFVGKPFSPDILFGKRARYARRRRGETGEV